MTGTLSARARSCSIRRCSAPIPRCRLARHSIPQGRLLVFASSYNASYNTTLIYRFQRGGYPDAFFGDNGMLALQQQNFAFFGHQWTVLAANGSGFVLVEWLAACGCRNSTSTDNWCLRTAMAARRDLCSPAPA